MRKGSVKDVVARYGHVIVDECHHLPAFSFERVLAEVKARFVTGLTATPYRRDGHQPILHMQVRAVRFAIEAGVAGTVRPFEHKLVCRTTAFAGAAEASIQEHYAALVADEARNKEILDDVERALIEGRSPLVLTERKDHLEYLATKLEPRARHLVVLYGGRGTEDDSRSSTSSQSPTTKSDSSSRRVATSAKGSTTRDWTRSSSPCPCLGRGR